MIYLRNQILRTLVTKDEYTGTFYREATRTTGILYPDIDDIQDDPSINHGGVVLISSLAELRTFVRTLYYVVVFARIITALLNISVIVSIRKDGPSVLHFVLLLVTLILFGITAYIVPQLSFPSGKVIDRIGNYIDLETGGSNLHGGCRIW